MQSATTTTPDPAFKATNSVKANNRRNIGACIAFAACALACSLPLIGGLVAGSFLDKIFDSPFMAVGVATVVVIAFGAAMQRRKTLRAATSGDMNDDTCNRFGC